MSYTNNDGGIHLLDPFKLFFIRVKGWNIKLTDDIMLICQNLKSIKECKQNVKFTKITDTTFGFEVEHGYASTVEQFYELIFLKMWLNSLVLYGGMVWKILQLAKK